MCTCEEGWAGIGCDSECSGHGKIVNGTCKCDYDTGWKGRLCDVPGCPGLFGIDCSGRGKKYKYNWVNYYKSSFRIGRFSRNATIFS